MKSLFLKKATQQDKTTPWRRKKKSPPLNLKALFLFLIGGQMGSSDIMQHYSWKLNGSSILPTPTYRYRRWERLLFAIWSRCGWTKWREDVQLEEPINQLPRAVCLDKYHLLLNSQRKISHIPGTCWFSVYCAEAFVFFDIPNPMCVSEWRSYSLCLIWFWIMTEAFGALG